MRVKEFLTQKLMVVVAAVLLGSCSVHEWPHEEEIPDLPTYPITLHFTYEQDMPLYQIVEYETRTQPEEHDVRYTLEIYKIVNEYLSKKELVLREVLYKEDVSQLDNSLVVELTEGKYMFHLWTDYVDAGSTTDRYYNADNFSAIVITQHEGNNDYRDAFVGHLQTQVTPETTNLLITNKRPLAKFKFISTDLDEFVEEMLELEQKKNPEADDTTRGVDFSQYKVMIQYSQNMPSEYDHFLDMPVDIIPNVRFESKISVLSDTEAELGFDYVFTNNSDFPTPINLVVYDKEGNSVAAVNDIPVPLRRGELTIVRGRFLTQQASGGIGIDPEFEDPDYIYNVP